MNIKKMWIKDKIILILLATAALLWAIKNVKNKEEKLEDFFLDTNSNNFKRLRRPITRNFDFELSREKPITIKEFEEEVEEEFWCTIENSENEYWFFIWKVKKDNLEEELVKCKKNEELTQEQLDDYFDGHYSSLEEYNKACENSFKEFNSNLANISWIKEDSSTKIFKVQKIETRNWKKVAILE